MKRAFASYVVNKFPYKQVTSLVNQAVEICNKKIDNLYMFPEPKDIGEMSFELLKTMKSKKETLKNFSLWFQNKEGGNDIDQLLTVKGVGTWTVNYIKIRAFCDTNIWLENDLGIKKAIKNIDKL